MAQSTSTGRTSNEPSQLGNAFVAELKDRTEYLFGSPTSGRKVMADFSEDRLQSEPLDEYLEAIVAQIQEYFSGTLLDTHTRTLPIGQATVLHFFLPPNHESEVGQDQRTALIPFPTGGIGKLTLLSRADDHEAVEEFDRLLNSLHRPEQPRDALEGIRILSATPEPAWKTSFPVGELSLDLTADYVRPEQFHFETADLQPFTLKVAGTALSPLATVTETGPDLVSIRNERGTVELSATTPNLWEKRPSAPSPAAMPEAAPTATTKSKSKSKEKTKTKARPMAATPEAVSVGEQPVEIPLAGATITLQAPPGTDEARAREMATAIEKSLNGSK